jgi:Mpv17 / PMP22 family
MWCSLRVFPPCLHTFYIFYFHLTVNFPFYFYFFPGFGWLATTFPKLTFSSVATRVALDQLAFTPIILSTFISSLWTLEHVMDNTNEDDDNKTPPPSLDIPGRLYDTLPSLWMTNIAVWTPVQLFNFGFVAQRYQVLFANMISLAWNAYISFSTRANNNNVVKKVENETSLPVSAEVVLVQRMTTKMANT